MVAVSRLLPMAPPPGQFPTTVGLALSCEVHNRASQYIAFMVRAYNGIRVGRQTPNRSLGAGVV